MHHPALLAAGFDIAAALDTVSVVAAEWALNVVAALVVLVVGRMVAGWIRAGVTKGLARAKVDDTLLPFFSGLVYWGVMAFVVLAVLGIFGIPTASAVAVLAAAGLAVGLALQGTLSNFASGVMLLTLRPFQVGHWVEVAGTGGTVQEVGIFNTVLNTADNVRIIVPNTQVYGEVIKNYTVNDTRRVDLVVGVSYDDDLTAAWEAIERVLASDDRILPEPEPNIQVSELGDSSVDFIVRPWCATGDYWALRWTLTRRLKEELEAAGCTIPYPQRDVHLHQTG